MENFFGGGRDAVEALIQLIPQLMGLTNGCNNGFNGPTSSFKFLCYADCFPIPTSLKENALLITGDPEFKKAGKLVQIEWL